MTTYTFEIYKTDRRLKEGRKMVRAVDMDLEPRILDRMLESYRKSFPKNKGFDVKVQETYTTKKTIFGKEYQERYDTPMCCSPASERFWTM